MNHYVCIHGHFYQPPRENPWLEEVELQDSAYPYHDWNERIMAKCYAPNTASRILGAERKIIDIVNNYSKISFNFASTLLSWMEKHAPEVYRAVIEADIESQKKFSGHGSAIAQAYNHMIMPIANSRDKRAQIIWGIKDFEHRFKRKPEGMWLPETAVDLETLDIVSEHGIKFTILAPRQAKRVRKIDGKKWKDVGNEKIDPKMPYLCKLPSGRTINIFFYDGPISNDVAFGDLLNNGEVFAKRLLGAFPQEHEQPQIVHIATDGETYGHHLRFGDMALAYCLYYIESNNLAKITIYGEYLEKHPSTHEVEIFENSSWSCTHGVERWRSDCGCKGMHPEWNQGWRAPLREAMDWLRDTLVSIYEKEMAQYMKDPWQARTDYIEVILDRSVQNVERFFSEHAVRELSKEEKLKVLKLLEMQRCAMLMYTSCGWFFDEISGIETVQVMRYAARAMQLAKEISGVDLEPNYVKTLERAPSNIPEFNNGAKVYGMLVKPATIDLPRVGAHYAISSLFEAYPETAKIYCYTANSKIYDKVEAGKQKLAVGRTHLHSDITWEESGVGFAVLHFGDHNLIGRMREHMEDDTFSVMHQEIKDAFLKSNVAEVIHLMDKYFGTHNYSIWHLFRDEQRKILGRIVEGTLKDIETHFRQIYKHHYSLMQVMKERDTPLPKALATPLEFILNTDLRKLLENDELDFDQLQNLIEKVKRWPIELDKITVGFVASQRVNKLMGKLSQTPEDVLVLQNIEAILRILSTLPLELDMWKAQNVYFSIGKQLYGGMRERAEKEDNNAKKWIEHFNGLGHYLQVKIT